MSIQSTRYIHRRPVLQGARSLLALAALAASCAAQASVGTPAVTTAYGAIEQTPYGATGLIYELKPFAFIDGLGLPANALDVVVRNPSLSFATTYSGFGTGLATVEYRISNVGKSTTFSDVRFMVFANPDGGDAPYLDQVALVTGAASTTNPSVLEARAITDTQLVTDSLLGRFGSQRSLTKGVDADCLAAAGCDTEMALQWNAALKPGESLVVRVGLSDDGRALSTSYLQALSRTDAATQLTFSGTGQVVAVPEAQSWLLSAMGLALTGLVQWRRRYRHGA
jgi:hypothetical protein